MKQTNHCPKCQSTDIIPNARPLDRGFPHTAEVATYRNPGAFLFKGRQSTALTAWVCAQCGYVEFYAGDPKGAKGNGRLIAANCSIKMEGSLTGQDVLAKEEIAAV